MKAIAAVILGIGLATMGHDASAQQSGGFDPIGQARDALAEPFVGLTTDGTPRPDLFEIRTTGVSTAPVLEAARTFISALNEDQRERLMFAVDDEAWRNWANIHLFPREGVALSEMNDGQRASAYALLRASLSAKGYETSRDIMRLNHHLAELVSNFEDYGEQSWASLQRPSPGAGRSRATI